LTADVLKGLPAGFYRVSSINAAANHQEALGPVAQRGSFNDVVYITVTEGGNDAVSSSTVQPTDTPPDVSSTSPAVPSSTGGGGKDPKTSPGTGGDDTISSSADLPVSTSGGGKNGDKGGDIVSTSTAPPESTTSPAGGDKPDTKDPVVSSSAELPDSTSTGGGNGRGDNKGGNGQYRYARRVHKRSRHA